MTNEHPISKADLLRLVEAQPDGTTFVLWVGGLSVMDPAGRYVGYIDLALRHEYVALDRTAKPGTMIG